MPASTPLIPGAAGPPAPRLSPRMRGFLLFVLILAAALSRLVPHPPNFSPIEAMALFGGAYFMHRTWAVLAPLIAMLVSDFLLGLTMGGIYLEYFVSAHFLTIYACIALCAVLGFTLRERVGSLRVLGCAIAGSLLFFLLTNYAVWLTATDIATSPACGRSLGACYLAAVPFLKWTLLGTLFYAALLFGGYELLQRRLPSLRAPRLAVS